MLSFRAYQGSLGLLVQLDKEETRSVKCFYKTTSVAGLNVSFKPFKLCSEWFWQFKVNIAQRWKSDLESPPLLFQRRSLWIHFNPAAAAAACQTFTKAIGTLSFFYLGFFIFFVFFLFSKLQQWHLQKHLLLLLTPQLGWCVNSHFTGRDTHCSIW